MTQYTLIDQLLCTRRSLFAGNNLYAAFQGHDYLQSQCFSTLFPFYFFAVLQMCVSQTPTWKQITRHWLPNTSTEVR